MVVEHREKNKINVLRRLDRNVAVVCRSLSAFLRITLQIAIV